MSLGRVVGLGFGLFLLSRGVLALTPSQLSTCIYAPGVFGQVCCNPGENCNANMCNCPSGWNCQNHVCTAVCTSFLLQTNSGNPRDSFTNCETQQYMRGMPNCVCPNPANNNQGIEAVCISDFHHNNAPKKLCSYKKRNRKGIRYRRPKKKG